MLRTPTVIWSPTAQLPAYPEASTCLWGQCWWHPESLPWLSWKEVTRCQRQCLSAFSTGFVGQSGCIISKASIEKVFAGICHISLVCNNTILSFLVLFLGFSQSTSWMHVYPSLFVFFFSFLDFHGISDNTKVESAWYFCLIHRKTFKINSF